MFVRSSSAVILVTLLALAGPAPALPRPKPVPATPWSRVYYGYADAILKNGRDNQGPQKTGLILSALDLPAMAPLTERPAAPAGLRQEMRAGAADGPLVGASPLHDHNLLRLLYVLTETSTRPIYRDAADAELKWLLQNAVQAEGAPPPWDGGFAWDVMADKPLPLALDAGPHRPWMLWDRCFDLDPEASKRLALSLRVAAKDVKGARRAGFAIRAFSVAYQRTRDEAFLAAIDSVLTPLEKFGAANASPVERLSLAIDCGGAVPRLPESVAARLRVMAAFHDAGFCGVPHDVKGKGFHAVDRFAATPLWVAGDNGYTTAKVAMMCVSRYENTGDTRYRDLVHAAADAYRDSVPPAEADTWPATFGHAIGLQLAAWRSTSNEAYLERAKAMADLSVKTFWPDGSPLPRASAKSRHYEAVTGADTLALALLELNLSVLHVTAVRCPPNTIDR